MANRWYWLMFAWRSHHFTPFTRTRLRDPLFYFLKVIDPLKFPLYKNRIMQIKDFKRIRLHWIDILGDTAWADNDEFNEMECSTCVSEGYLFYSDQNKLMTFASYEAEDGEIISYGDRNVYPIGCVKEIEYL